MNLKPSFQLLRFSPRKQLKGAAAAEMSVDGVSQWMTRQNIRHALMVYGDDKELWKAMEAYDSGEEYSIT